jgi:ABC-type dipeptide/oligopeptide/nickel transport system permease subunit
VWPCYPRCCLLRSTFLLISFRPGSIRDWISDDRSSRNRGGNRDASPPDCRPHGGSWTHVLGTDQLGRDLFVRTLIGLQNALTISLCAVVIMFTVGAAVGMASGYYGGWTDAILMRLADAQLAIPLIVLAITFLTIPRPTPEAIVLVLALAGWPAYARVTRSVMLSERRREYVRGAKILGASDFRVIMQMIAPNILPPVVFVAVLDIARMMIFEVALACSRPLRPSAPSSLMGATISSMDGGFRQCPVSSFSPHCWEST